MSENNELLPCPYCGSMPTFPSGNGTQYELECGGDDCPMYPVASVQIRDCIPTEERGHEQFVNCRYEEKYIEAARKRAIEIWNTRFVKYRVDDEPLHGNRLYRHESDPAEKEIHDLFVAEYGNIRTLSQMIFQQGMGGDPVEYLSEREERIVVTTIQWLGSPVGQSFSRKIEEINKKYHRKH